MVSPSMTLAGPVSESVRRLNVKFRLQLFRGGLQLANFLRTLALPEEVEHWSLTTLRERLVKIGARIVRHGRYVVFQLAGVAVPRTLFADILHRIDRLRPRPPPLPA
jgi:Transposase DDE domain group 1